MDKFNPGSELIESLADFMSLGDSLYRGLNFISHHGNNFLCTRIRFMFAFLLNLKSKHFP